MNIIIYNVIHSIVYLLALMPFWVMYRISDLIYLVMYYFFSYRKKVVFENLKNSFPNKSEEEITKIAKDFYRYFFDLMLETFKTLTMTKNQARKRCVFDSNSLELFNKLYDENKDVIIVLGHYGNWEIGGTSFNSYCKQNLSVIYKPLTNKYIDKLIYNMRTRWGSKLIPMKETYETMKSTKGTKSATAFIADQTPSPDNAYWTTFLNQDTPVFWGTERIAKKLKYPIVYMSVKRLKRGYYKIFTEMLIENPRQTKEGEISKAFTRGLEKDIIEQPEIWLWSHRRWKHKDKLHLKK
jgi:Kdo2-lipid IVA lauroyltransferase/acyltransferase